MYTLARDSIREEAPVPVPRLSPDSLRSFATRVLGTLDVPGDDAALVADSLVQADLWGHQSHGVLRLPWYVARLRSGVMTARTEPAVLSDTGPLVLLDGRDGVGQVLTERARTTAVERARTHGVGVVGVRNSNHFGTAMYWTRRAAQDGCVAVLTTNASPAVARGKIHLAKNRGEPIPDTWALSPDGAPTTDPAEGVLGVILPMAGHKGYAIAFLMDVLSGALTGSAVGTRVHGPYEPDRRSGAGHLFLALDPSAFGDPAGFEARVRQLVDEVKSVPLAQGFDEVFYPGEVEDRAEAANLAAGGVTLAGETLAGLHRLAAETGVPFDDGSAR